jgi:hypothetical protein
MTPFRFVLLAAGFSAALAAPALAAWDRVGSVDIDYRLDRTSQYGNFGGPVQTVQLRAVGSDVACRTINAQFGNGQTRDLWRGTLREGRPVNIDLPGNARNLRQLEFVSRATGPRARVEIYADTASWGGGGGGNGGPGWRPPIGPGVPPVQQPPAWNDNDWIALGSARFGNNNGETTVDGANGRHFQKVGLRARGGDAQCRAVVIRFTNGEKVSLDVNGGRVMREGQLYPVELPGWRRNILRLALSCRAVRSDYTSIQVYASR